MHPAHVFNSTDVIFGLLSDPMDAPVKAVYLSVLRSSLIGLFFQQINLTLTNSTFGQPTLFEILKFPGGVTVIPEKSASIWQIPQIFFNFTLHNSIYDIKQNFADLKEQLRSGLHLAPDEVLYRFTFIHLPRQAFNISFHIGYSRVCFFQAWMCRK